MGHCGGRAGQRLGPAEADREVGDREVVEEGERLFLAALQVKRKGRAGAGAMPRVNIGLPRAFLQEAEVADLLDLWMMAEEFAHLDRILAGALHPKLQRLQAAQEHPC